MRQLLDDHAPQVAGPPALRVTRRANCDGASRPVILAFEVGWTLAVCRTLFAGVGAASAWVLPLLERRSVRAYATAVHRENYVKKGKRGAVLAKHALRVVN
jgi:hypothetical protein